MLCLATGRNPKDVLELEPWEFSILWESLPEHRGFSAYPVAQLIAEFRDMFFPKLAPGESPPVSDKPAAPRWTAQEIIEEMPGHRLDIAIEYDEAVRLELIQFEEKLPDWVKHLVSWESVHQ